MREPLFLHAAKKIVISTEGEAEVEKPAVSTILLDITKI